MLKKRKSRHSQGSLLGVIERTPAANSFEEIKGGKPPFSLITGWSSAAVAWAQAGVERDRKSQLTLAYPGRQCISVVGDGDFVMLMAELTTAVANKLPVKIILLKNNRLAEGRSKQKEIGNPEFGCDLTPIDFVGLPRGVAPMVPLLTTRRIRPTI